MSEGNKKVVVQATEMYDVDVQYISLVDKGANRIPFRIIKSRHKEDGSMVNLDLSRIFKRVQTPVVQAIIVSKAEVPEKVLEAIKAAGFSVDSPETQGDCTVFKQTDAQDEVVAVKLNDHTAIAVKADVLKMPVCKAEESWASDFYESLHKDGFWPVYGSATYYMQDTLQKALHNCGSSDEAKKAAAEVLGAFTEYTLAMVSSIPAQAFSMGEGVMKAFSEESPEKDAPTDTATDTATDTDVSKSYTSEGTTEKTETTTSADTKSDSPETQVDKSETTTGEGDNQGDELSQVVKSLSDIMTAISALKGEITGISSSVEVLKAANTELAGKMAEVEEVAKTASSAVLGGDPSPDTTEQPENVGKSESSAIIDTAFQPHVRKHLQEVRRSRGNRGFRTL